MRIRRALTILAAVLAAPVCGDIENRNLFPFGEREVLLGNAGTAGGPSTGSVYYNPAALALLDHPQISVSGSTYLASSLDVTPIAVADNTNLDYHASGFDTIPATVISTLRSGEWTLALSILVPDSVKLENRLTFPTPNTSTTLIQVITVGDLDLALSAGRFVSKDFAFGVSVFAVQHRESLTLNATSRVPATPNVAGVSTSHLSSTVYNLSLTAGALWRAADWMELGLRLESPALRIAGSGDGYKFQQTIGAAGAQTITEVANQDIAARYSLPFDASLGARFHPAPALGILFDVSLQTGASFDQYPGSNFSSITNVGATLRYNLGFELDVSPTVRLGTGVFYNPSARAAPVSEGDSYRDFYGVTGGLSFLSDRVRSGAGLFYLWSHGQLIPSGNPSGRGRIAQTGLGGTLVFSYLL